jgi:hypothetical protein
VCVCVCVCVCGCARACALIVMKVEKEPWTWTDSLDKRPRRWNMDMRFGMWNIRSLYRAGSLATVSKELLKYKLY